MITAAELIAVAQVRTFPCGHHRSEDNIKRTSQGYARCRMCSMERVRAYFQDHYCFGKYRMTKRQVTNFALLRDRRLVNRNAIHGLVRVGFAFYDSIMNCYRCDPLVLAEFERTSYGHSM